MARTTSLSALPGGDLVEQGFADLGAGRETVEALLVAIGARRLRAAGIEVPGIPVELPEHRLYAILEAGDPAAAHAAYNALLRRLVSFERALEARRRRKSAPAARPGPAGRPGRMRRAANARRITAFLAGLGRAATQDATCYLLGGATAVLSGWRESTIDVDVHLEPAADELLRAIQDLKERLEVNIELASPADFIPSYPVGAIEVHSSPNTDA